MMVLEKKIRRLFRELGLGEPSIKTYLTLVYLGGRATAEQIIASTGLPASSVYKALRVLEEHGLVEALATKPRTYRVVPPDKKLKILIEEHARELISIADEVSTAIEASMAEATGETAFTSISGWNNVLETMELMAKSSRHEILVYAPANIVSRLYRALREAVQRGVYVSLIVTNTFIQPLESRSVCSEISTIARERPYGSRILVITDSRAALIAPLSLGNQSIYMPRAVYVEDRELGFIFTSYFHNRLAACSMEIYSRVQPGDEYVFNNVQSAIDYITHALDRRYEVYAVVKGKTTFWLEDIVLKGSVCGVVVKPDKGVYSIILDTGGLVYLVGGHRAFLEDVMASEIRVYTTSVGAPRKLLEH